MTEPTDGAVLVAAPAKVGAGALHPSHAAPAEERSGRPERSHLQVVEPRGRRRWIGGRWFFLFAASVVIAVAFGLVYLHVVEAERQFRLDDLNAQVTREQARYQTLRLQVAQLDSPQQIISKAEGQLGMRQPTNVIYLSPKSSSAAAGSATGGSGLASTPAAPKGVAPAPKGDADWPAIKASLAGSP